MAIAERLMIGATSAFGGARQLLFAAPTSSRKHHLDLGAARIAKTGEHAEGREGVNAFLARRKPDFLRASN
ncbi:MAG: hypothetical protein NW206_20830 [Hyphomonadaceae bacterium]|nr:hypothetical protein [Hyphomonadaceae bacterium]